MGYNFTGAAAKRLDNQNNMAASNDLKEAQVIEEAPAEKKERYSIALYPSSKKKLDEKAKKSGISMSSQIEIWISEFC